MASSNVKVDQEAKLISAASQLLALRALRIKLFPRPIFTDIGWELLLLLYSGAVEGPRTLGALAEAAQAPVSTTARWIRYLEDEGFLYCRRRSLHQDAQFDLSDKALRSIRFFLCEVPRIGEWIERTH